MAYDKCKFSLEDTQAQIEAFFAKGGEVSKVPAATPLTGQKRFNEASKAFKASKPAMKRAVIDQNGDVVPWA